MVEVQRVGDSIWSSCGVGGPVRGGLPE